MIKQCVLCNKSYEVTRGCVIKKRKFCSPSCKTEYHLIKGNKSGNFTQRYKYRQGKIIRETMSLSPTQLQMCIGTLLGDASIDISRAGSASLRMQHCEKQLDYLEWKKSIISNFVVREKPTVCRPTGFSKNQSYLYQTVTHQDFTKLHTYLYVINGKTRRKILTSELLEKLDIFGVLFWYLDDGAVAPSKGRSSLRFHTNNFTKIEHELIIQYFQKKYQIVPKTYYIKSQDQYILAINANDSQKLMRLFKPFINQIPRCMHYKLV